MITLLKIAGIFFVALVAYHYINKPLGFTPAQAVALVFFSFCLIELYEGYRPDRKNWTGWGLIATGCVVLAGFTAFSWLLLLPAGLFVSGYCLAELPFDIRSLCGDGYDFSDGSGSSGGDGCGGGGGDC